MRATVLVTLLNDPRVARTLDSLAAQERLPDAVLVADGGSADGSVDAARAFAARHAFARVEHHPGSVAETRNSALAARAGEGVDVVVFLDADQIAPPGWLGALLAPIERGEADYSGGPTRPPGPALSPAERYLNDFEAWFYPNVVARDLTKLPMGNSAWRTSVFDRIGNFDARLTWGGEDYDVNVRAARAGFRGRYVPEAWVVHDQSRLDSARRVLRRKYRYNVGATMAYLKNGVLGAKMRDAARTTVRFRHPYEITNVVLQPIALAHGWWRWRRIAAQGPKGYFAIG